MENDGRVFRSASLGVRVFRSEPEQPFYCGACYREADVVPIFDRLICKACLQKTLELFN